MTEKFTASMLKNPLFPDKVEFSDKGVSFKIQKALRSSENFVFYSDISGVELDEGVMFTTIHVLPRQREKITIKNFSKRDARRVKELILEKAG